MRRFLLLACLVVLGADPASAGLSFGGETLRDKWREMNTPGSGGGGGAALPIWMSYMEKALKDVPQAAYAMPDNMVTVRINENGQRDANGSLFEYFYQENIPPEQAMPPVPNEEARPADAIKDQLL